MLIFLSIRIDWTERVSDYGIAGKENGRTHAQALNPKINRSQPEADKCVQEHRPTMSEQRWRDRNHNFGTSRLTWFSPCSNRKRARSSLAS
jgi:hypothetical protein